MHDYLCGGTVFVTTDHEDGTSSTRCACSFINTVQLSLNYFGHTHE